MIGFLYVIAFCLIWLGTFIGDYFTAFKLISRAVLYVSMAVMPLSVTGLYISFILKECGHRIPEWLCVGDFCDKIVGENYQGLWIPLVALFFIALQEGMILINYKSKE